MPMYLSESGDYSPRLASQHLGSGSFTMAQPKTSDHLDQVKRSIQVAIENKESENRQKLLTYRIDLARAGITAFRQGNMPVAVKSFLTYLRILEEFKNVPDGGLTPSHFNLTTDLSELLVISGVYWDLVKVHDKVHAGGKTEEFNRYLDKYLLFAKGMPFQGVCAETIRKYLAYEKPLHRDALRAAYQLLSQSYCFIATALIDELSPETPERLRRLRDRHLRAHWGGRAFIRFYYRVGPLLGRWMLSWPAPARRTLGRLLDQLARKTTQWIS